MFLTCEQLQRLTGKKRNPAQVRALRCMGIEHKIRPDGAVLVLAAHIEKILDGQNTTAVRKRTEPNWNNV